MSDEWKPRRSISRRGLLIGGGGGLLLIGGVAAAVTLQQNESAPAASDAAGSGGVLRVGANFASSAVLDSSSPSLLFQTSSALFGYLTFLDEEGVVQPGVASSWTSNATADQWTFQLRDDVRFHNGQQLTSEDVQYSLRRVFDEALASPAAGVLNPVLTADGITAPDASTVVFNLFSPHAELPTVLTNCRLGIIPAGSGDTVGQTGISCGPFKVKTFEQGRTVVLERFEEYHGGRAPLDGIEFIPIPDVQARVEALVGDQIDLAEWNSNLDDGTTQVVNSSAGCRVFEAPGSYWKTVVMHVDRKPVDDERVRRALKLAVDPQGIIDTVLGGAGVAANHNPVRPQDPHYIELPWTQDIDQARALLAEAGYADGLTISLATAPYTPSHVPLAVALKEMLAPAGITVTVNQGSTDSYYDQQYATDPLGVDWWGTRPADQTLSEFFLSGAALNSYGWSNPRFDDLIAQARAEVDDNTRSEIYKDAQRLIQEEGPAIIPFFENARIGMRTRVKNYGNSAGEGNPDPAVYPNFFTITLQDD